MKLNTNMIHNILNALLVALGAALLQSGCVADTVTGALDCSKSWIDPRYTTWAITLVGFLKIAMNVVRDGFFGLFSKQPPVVK